MFFFKILFEQDLFNMLFLIKIPGAFSKRKQDTQRVYKITGTYSRLI